LAGEQHQAKVAYLFPQTSSKTGSDGGVLRLFGGHPNSKEGRKAPEVLFERESVYIWNVQLKSGDLNYVLQENDKVFVEIADLLGKEKKKWQNKLGTISVPKFVASLVFVGGGRPKADRVNEDFTKNANLVQWLNKRNIDISLFSRLIAGKLPQKTLETTGDDLYSQDYPNPGGSYQNTGMLKQKQATPFNNPVLVGSSLSRPHTGSWGHGPSISNTMKSNAFANPIMRQAEDLTQRTMLLQSPEDPEVTNLIQDDGEAQLALFLSKTLTNAIMMYRQGGPNVGPIGPPGNKPGPIGPPRGKGGNVRGGRGGQDFNEFYADSAISGRGGAGRGGGLYGLSEPLLQYHNSQHSPGQHFSSNASMEPPFKRKYEDW